MKKIVINGNKELTGTVNISGAKNSVVALIPAALLSDEEVTITNVPDVSDVKALKEIMNYLNAEIKCEGTTITINCKNIKNKLVPFDISKKLRASYYFMSSLLGKFNYVEMFFPGGCNIGARPIDQTLKSFKSLGAQIIEEDDFYTIKADRLIGSTIKLDMPSVGATINAIFAAVKANGETLIENAAREPEIDNIVQLLNNMGAKITGSGTSKIKIKGVKYLKSATINVIPDRIEAGTYIILGALIGKNLKINNIIPEHLKSLTDALKKMEIDLKINEDNIVISKSSNLKPISIETNGYPGFPTDLQQPFTVLLTQANGRSELVENIYENRFQNVSYLNQMGASMNYLDRKLTVNGLTVLEGKIVEATDLRAGACLVLAGLLASGTTEITNVEHILRGYENIISKLKNIDADIKLIEE